MSQVGVIFDLDGTLVDSLADIASAMNHTLQAFGFTSLPVHDYRPFIGDGIDEMVKRSVPVGEHHRVREVIAAYRAHYAKNLVVQTVPYPGIPELLARLDAAKVPMAVLSNKLDAAVRAIVGKLFPDVSFRCVFGEREGIARKPDPQAAREAASALGVRARDVLFVGDTEVDIRCAKAARCRSVAALWGMRPREVLEAERPDILIERPLELLGHVGGHGGVEQTA